MVVKIRSMLALVTEAWGGRGGIAQYNRDLLSALNTEDEGISIEILPRLAGDAVEDVPAGLIQCPARPGKVGYAAEALRRAMAMKPDILFCGHLNMAPLSLLIAKATGAALVIQLHGIEIWQAPGALQRRALEEAALVLCVSRHTRGEVLKHAAIPPHRVRVHANTYAEDFLPGDRQAARARFDIPAAAFCILSVGRLDSRERYKGHDRVIRALPALRGERPEVLYLISGEGDDRSRLEALAEETAVTDSVRFIGHVSRDSLPDLYRAADLFALPSTGEGFGIVFLEAMACGTPALGLGVAGARDALADGGLGSAPSEDELGAALLSAVALRERDERALAEAVKVRYGRERFAAHAATVFNWSD